jgi:hypothetical protein
MYAYRRYKERLQNDNSYREGTLISKDSEAWSDLLRLIAEDRAESAPAQSEDER